MSTLHWVKLAASEPFKWDTNGGTGLWPGSKQWTRVFCGKAVIEDWYHKYKVPFAHSLNGNLLMTLWERILLIRLFLGGLARDFGTQIITNSLGFLDKKIEYGQRPSLKLLLISVIHAGNQSCLHFVYVMLGSSCLLVVSQSFASFCLVETRDFITSWVFNVPKLNDTWNESKFVMRVIFTNRNAG